MRQNQTKPSHKLSTPGLRQALDMSRAHNADLKRAVVRLAQFVGDQERVLAALHFQGSIVRFEKAHLIALRK